MPNIISVVHFLPTQKNPDDLSELHLTRGIFSAGMLVINGYVRVMHRFLVINEYVRVMHQYLSFLSMDILEQCISIFHFLKMDILEHCISSFSFH